MAEKGLMMKRLVLTVAVIAAFACIAEAARPTLVVNNGEAGAVIAKERTVTKTVTIEEESPCVFDTCATTAPRAFVRKYQQPRVWLPRTWAAPCAVCVPQANTAVYEVTEEPQKPWINRGVLRDRVVIPKRPVVTVERVQ